MKRVSQYKACGRHVWPLQYCLPPYYFLSYISKLLIPSSLFAHIIHTISAEWNQQSLTHSVLWGFSQNNTLINILSIGKYGSNSFSVISTNLNQYNSRKNKHWPQVKTHLYFFFLRKSSVLSSRKNFLIVPKSWIEEFVLMVTFPLMNS